VSAIVVSSSFGFMGMNRRFGPALADPPGSAVLAGSYTTIWDVIFAGAAVG
jgi:hypothetical protein